MNLGQRVVFCHTVDKYFHLMLIAFKTISVVHLTYLDAYRRFTLNVTLRRVRIILLPRQSRSTAYRQTHNQINHTSIDRRWHLITLNKRSFRGTKGGFTHSMPFPCRSPAMPRC
jgi:hypothetical protein